MTEAILDERHRQVLTAVIGEYLETAEPVGSRAVARRHGLGVSPATIRNAMADLEEMGYLSQPHTSAGRVPTDKAFRLYVDSSMSDLRLSESEAIRLRQQYARPQGGIEQLMEQTSLHLSAFSRMTGVLLAPPLKQTRLHRINLILLSDDQVLAVVVTDAGWVTTRTLTVESPVTGDNLRELSRQLTRRFGGKTFQEILDHVTAPPDPLDPLRARSGGIVDQVFSLLRDRRLYIGGAMNILEHREFWGLGTMRALLWAFEEKAHLIDLLSTLAGEQGVQVMIGRENPVEEMRECSLITSTYTYNDRVLGILGVVGPKRMPYSKMIPLVDETARLVSQSLSRVRQELYLPS
ncbi:MAG: heat-inducible transcription repressor HrcA [Candidatus Rokubacteria bacterium]|nr:heat-inducible transcription repressor HrcA [Candidatus Rokubacteria bacterium]